MLPLRGCSDVAGRPDRLSTGSRQLRGIIVKPRVLLTLPVSPDVMEEYGTRVEFIAAPGRSFDEIRQAANGCDAIIVRVPLPEDICEAAPSIRVIARHGAGLDMIPVKAATRARVPVVNVPGVNARSVAEHGVMQMLRLARCERQFGGLTGQRKWEDARGVAMNATELAGQTAGIIGMGNVGRTLAEILNTGFGMNILSSGVRRANWPGYVEDVTLERLLGDSDFVLLCLPLTSTTRGMIDAKALDRMKQGAFLVNLARGGVTVEQDVATALEKGAIAGAAIDVFERQPLPSDHIFWQIPNLLISPHVAGMSKTSLSAMGMMSISQSLQVLKGERPPHLVNPEIWEKRR